MSLRCGLRRGLLSGLLTTTSGMLEVPAGGWPPVEALALFALWASVSTSLRRKEQDQEKWRRRGNGNNRKTGYLLVFHLLFCCLPLPPRAKRPKIEVGLQADVCGRRGRGRSPAALG